MDIFSFIDTTPWLELASLIFLISLILNKKNKESYLKSLYYAFFLGLIIIFLFPTPENLGAFFWPTMFLMIGKAYIKYDEQKNNIKHPTKKKRFLLFIKTLFRYILFALGIIVIIILIIFVIGYIISLYSEFAAKSTIAVRNYNYDIGSVYKNLT